MNRAGEHDGRPERQRKPEPERKPGPERDAAIDRWFRRRGLSMMLGGTGVESAPSVRAVLPLSLAYAVMMVLIVPLYTGLTLGTGLLVAVAVLLATWLFTNVRRGRPAFARPRSIGWPECVLFVLAPMVPLLVWPAYDEIGDAVAGGELDVQTAWAAVVTIVGLIQVTILALVFAVVVFGLGSLSQWLLRTVYAALTGGASALLTMLPVVMGVVFFFFLNPGVWVTVGRATAWAYTGIIALLLLLAGAFLGARHQFDLAAAAHFEDDAQLGAALDGTPLQGEPLHLDGPTDCPLGRLATVNLRAIAILSRLVMALVIASAVFAFFLVLGYLAVDLDAVKGWTRTDPSVLLRFVTRQHEYVLTAEHGRVAGFLATFAAFNYSLASATDARLRHDVSEAAEDMARQACAVRLALLLRQTSSGPVASEPPASEPTTPAEPAH